MKCAALGFGGVGRGLAQIEGGAGDGGDQGQRHYHGQEGPFGSESQHIHLISSQVQASAFPAGAWSLVSGPGQGTGPARRPAAAGVAGAGWEQG